MKWKAIMWIAAMAAVCFADYFGYTHHIAAKPTPHAIGTALCVQVKPAPFTLSESERDMLGAIRMHLAAGDDVYVGEVDGKVRVCGVPRVYGNEAKKGRAYSR